MTTIQVVFKSDMLNAAGMTSIVDLANQITQLGHLGCEWERMCESLQDSLQLQELNLEKKFKVQIESLNNELAKLNKEKEKWQKQSKKSMQRTQRMFERSLGDIKRTYEKS